MIDFVGVGAQRCGTSWIYACLYEHPQICAPVKELHFFSRERNWERGLGWYLGHFERCPPDSVRGEFSTSYLYAPEAAGRIREALPDARILVSLRDPVARAFSQYRNAILAGEIGKDTPFADYARGEASAISQGLYAGQLERYLDAFGRERVLVLVLEDAERGRAAFVRRIYEFLGVDPSFRPETLGRAVNATRTPRSVALDRTMVRAGNALRRAGFDRLVWRLKRTGVPDLLRGANTERDERSLPEAERERLRELYRPDAERLSELLGRDLAALWGLRG